MIKARARAMAGKDITMIMEVRVRAEKVTVMIATQQHLMRPRRLCLAKLQVLSLVQNLPSSQLKIQLASLPIYQPLFQVLSQPKIQALGKVISLPIHQRLPQATVQIQIQA